MHILPRWCLQAVAIVEAEVGKGLKLQLAEVVPKVEPGGAPVDVPGSFSAQQAENNLQRGGIQSQDSKAFGRCGEPEGDQCTLNLNIRRAHMREQDA